MKLSVVIIAHNEEDLIERCIQSVLSQETGVDEVIVVVHNSNDTTLETIKHFSDDHKLIVDNYYGPEGIVPARVRGISQATGDYIFCIDGDAYATKNWTKSLLESFKKDKQVVLTGSHVSFFGNLLWSIMSPLNKLFASLSSNKITWIWGPSFSFTQENKMNVIRFLNESVEVSKTLTLNRNPDDYWLALRMSGLGKVAHTTQATVSAKTKQLSNRDAWIRSQSDVANGKKMLKCYLEKFV